MKKTSWLLKESKYQTFQVFETRKVLKKEIPMTILRIPTPLRPYADGTGEIKINAHTVSAAMDELTQTYPDLKKHLFTEEGQLRAYVNLFLNDEDIRHLDGVDTRLSDGDRLMIIPSIAGGR
jgi:MoaD family protein